MRNGCKVILNGVVGRYERILPSGKMLVRFGKDLVSTDIRNIRPATRFSDLSWMDKIMEFVPGSFPAFSYGKRQVFKL